MMQGEGKIVGIDHIDDLVNMSIENLSWNFDEELKSGHIEMVVGDGWKGFKDHSPYDCIHVGAAAAEVPEELIE